MRPFFSGHCEVMISRQQGEHESVQSSVREGTVWKDDSQHCSGMPDDLTGHSLPASSPPSLSFCSLPSHSVSLSNVLAESADRAYVELPDEVDKIDSTFIPELLRCLKKGGSICVRSGLAPFPAPSSSPIHKPAPNSLPPLSHAPGALPLTNVRTNHQNSVQASCPGWRWSVLGRHSSLRGLCRLRQARGRRGDVRDGAAPSSSSPPGPPRPEHARAGGQEAQLGCKRRRPHLSQEEAGATHYFTKGLCLPCLLLPPLPSRQARADAPLPDVERVSGRRGRPNGRGHAPGCGRPQGQAQGR